MPALKARSTASGVATPSSTRRTASFINRACIRGPMNPGESAQRTGTLPSFSRNATVRSTTAVVVARPGTTSTSGMMCAGLSQWTTRKRSAPRIESARCLGEMVELVDAMIASGDTPADTRPRISRFRSTSSGNASCTYPQPSSPSSPIRSSSRSSAGAISPDSITSSSAIKVRSRRISRRASANTAAAPPACRSLTSTSDTRHPPRASASAIWRPILPGPRTAAWFIGAPRRSGGSAWPRSSTLAAVDHDHVLAHPAVVVREGDGGVRHLAGAGLAAELDEYLGRLSHSGGAERMPAAHQSAARVHHDVAAVVAPTRRHEGTGLALPAETQLLIRDQLGDREAVVDLGDVDVLRPHPGHPVGRLGGPRERRPVSVVLVERRQLEAVERLAGAADPDRLVGEVPRALFRRDQHRGRP